MYKATFHKSWPEFFDTLDNTIKERVTKKIQKILEYPKKGILQAEPNILLMK